MYICGAGVSVCVCVCVCVRTILYMLINIRRFTKTFPKSNKTLAPGIYSRVRVNIFIQFKFKPLESSFSLPFTE